MGEYDKVVGVLLIGLFFNVFLYGLVCYQFLLYHLTPFGDRLYIRIIVGSLFVVDTVHAFVSVYAGWETCVTNFNNPAFLGTVSWTIPFTAGATGFAALLTQAFLGWRVYLLTKSKPLVTIVFTLSTTSFVCAVTAGIQSGIIGTVSGLSRIQTISLLWLSFQTGTDIVLTVSLCWTLWRSRTGFGQTDGLIYRLMRGAIQTGFFVTVVALSEMFTFHFDTDTNLYTMFAYPIGRIYSNTLLYTLLARRDMRTKFSNRQCVDVESELRTSIRLGNIGIDVQVDREIDFQRDRDIVVGETSASGETRAVRSNWSGDRKPVNFG